MPTVEAKKQIAQRKAAGLSAFAGTALAYGAASQAAYADKATDLVNQAGSGGIASAKSLMDGDTGTVIYLVVGFAILAFIVGIVLYVVHKGKKG